MSPIFNLCNHSACNPSAELFFKLRKSGNGGTSREQQLLLPVAGSGGKSVACRSSALKGKTFRVDKFLNSVRLTQERSTGSKVELDDRPEVVVVVTDSVGKQRDAGAAESAPSKDSKGLSSQSVKKVKSSSNDAPETTPRVREPVVKHSKRSGTENNCQPSLNPKISRNQEVARRALDFKDAGISFNDATLTKIFKEKLESSTGNTIVAEGFFIEPNPRVESLSRMGDGGDVCKGDDGRSRNSSGFIQRLDGRETGDRSVDVQVEVVSWRERHIKAKICVEASDQKIWDVLTDYERLAEFIPNLIRSERISSPQSGRVWLLQQGVQSSMYWHIEARVVLDLEELPYEVGGKELRFSMVDGDFKRYEGRWYLRPGSRADTTMLYYEVNVTPKLLFPAAFVERIIRADLPTNLNALAQRAESDPSEWQKVVQLPKPVMKPTPSPIRSFLDKFSSPNFVQRFPVESIKAALQFPSLIERIGVDAVQRSILNSQEDELNTWDTREPGWGSSTRQCIMERPCAVDEVHLRRLDDLLENGGVHRRVVAAITVESSIRDVWDVLTDYECLSEFIPNLASSKIVSRENNRVRLVQEGCKCILYMVLHARVVLDLWEKPVEEIIFQQVEGDFDSFQGKWTLEALGSQHTLLKYVVDTKMHKHCLLAEAIVEEVIYEDLPANLCAIRDRVEKLKLNRGNDAPAEKDLPETGSQGITEEPTPSFPKMMPKLGRKRFRVAGLQKDFKILERELLAFIEENGKQGVMPMRSELRLHKRVDLEKAITRMGGFSTVASKLSLCQQRRPRGYWDNFQNVRKEIMQLQKECGMDANYLPTRNALNSAGRPDVARALEKWGGAQEVARLLGLKVRRVRFRTTRTNMFPEDANLENDEFICQKPFKISLPAQPRKWVNMKQEVGFIDKAES